MSCESHQTHAHSKRASACNSCLQNPCRLVSGNLQLQRKIKCRISYLILCEERSSSKQLADFSGVAVLRGDDQLLRQTHGGGDGGWERCSHDNVNSRVYTLLRTVWTSGQLRSKLISEIMQIEVGSFDRRPRYKVCRWGVKNFPSSIPNACDIESWILLLDSDF